MVLHGKPCGRVGRCRDFFPRARFGGLFFFVLALEHSFALALDTPGWWARGCSRVSLARPCGFPTLQCAQAGQAQPSEAAAHRRRTGGGARTDPLGSELRTDRAGESDVRGRQAEPRGARGERATGVVRGRAPMWDVTHRGSTRRRCTSPWCEHRGRTQRDASSVGARRARWRRVARRIGRGAPEGDRDRASAGGVARDVATDAIPTSPGRGVLLRSGGRTGA